MILALITGQLFRAPEARTSKNNKAFVAGTLRFKDGESFQFVRFVAFSASARDELMQLGDGDAVSVQGAFKAELYRPDSGEPKVSLSVIVNRALALRQPPKECKPTAPEPPQPSRARQEPGGGGPNDDIPFGAP
jgi:single-stranded DNA-binding protein